MKLVVVSCAWLFFMFSLMNFLVETTEVDVSHVDVFECRADGNRLLISESVKQLEWSPEDGFPRNAFHEKRLLNGNKIAVNGSKCYTFRLDFDKEVRIWIFVVKIWTEKWPVIVPRITPIFKYSNCVLKQISHHTRDNLATYSYSFVCDLEHLVNPKLKDSQEFRSLSIVVDPLSGVGLGLEALYAADIQSKIDAKC